MKRATLMLPWALLALLTGLTSTGHASRLESVGVRIQVTTFQSTVRHVHTFTLACNPTGGSLPLAGRVCRDISFYAAAMLNPPKPRWT